MCDCKSYNAQVGSVPSVILPRPDWLCDGEWMGGVPVDACIADTVTALWELGIYTWGSCCGHNGLVFNGRAMRPALVLNESVDPFEARRILAEIDDRAWELLQWQINEVGL